MHHYWQVINFFSELIIFTVFIETCGSSQSTLGKIYYKWQWKKILISVLTVKSSPIQITGWYLIYFWYYFQLILHISKYIQNIVWALNTHYFQVNYYFCCKSCQLRGLLGQMCLCYKVIGIVLKFLPRAPIFMIFLTYLNSCFQPKHFKCSFEFVYFSKSCLNIPSPRKGKKDLNETSCY